MAWAPKNNGDHNKLKINWPPKIINASVRWWPRGANNNRAKLSPIIIYSTVQTGPNNQLGGLNHGLVNVAYQSLTAGTVASEPMAAIAKQTMIDPTVTAIERETLIF